MVELRSNVELLMRFSINEGQWFVRLLVFGGMILKICQSFGAIFWYQWLSGFVGWLMARALVRSILFRQI